MKKLRAECSSFWHQLPR